MATEDAARSTTASGRATEPARLVDRLTTPTGLLLVSVMAMCLLPVTSAIRDPDFWWHLRSGQIILDTHQLIATDPYTYTVSSHAWVMHEWLTEVLFASLDRLGGLGLIVAVLSIVTWLGLLCILVRAAMRQPGRGVLAVGMLAAVIAGYPIWGPRAQMITFTLSCLVLLIYERYLTRGGRGIWLLPPLFLLWSNLHSGFVLGLGFAVAMVAGDAAGRALRMADPAPRRRLVRLLGMTVLCALVAMINPNGPQIVLYPFATVASPAQQSLILEWHSPDFAGMWEVRAFAGMVLSLIVMIAITRRIRGRDLALVLLTAGLSFQSVRNIALFVAAATPIWIDQLRLLLGARAARPAPAAPRAVRLGAVSLLLVVILTLFVTDRLVPAMAVGEDSLLTAQSFPVCAVRWLEQAPKPLRIFNQYGEGGYLALTLTPRGDRIFIFGDAALMGDEMLTTYSRLEGVQPGWEEILLQRYPTDIVLFDTGTPLARVLASSPRWVMVYSDAHNQAFVPRDKVASLQLPKQPPLPSDPSDTCVRLQKQPTEPG